MYRDCEKQKSQEARNVEIFSKENAAPPTTPRKEWSKTEGTSGMPQKESDCK